MIWALIIGGLGIILVCLWVGWQLAQADREVKMAYEAIKESHKSYLEIFKLAGDFTREILKKARR